jgi:hypothetical protein
MVRVSALAEQAEKLYATAVEYVDTEALRVWQEEASAFYRGLPGCQQIP